MSKRRRKVDLTKLKWADHPREEEEGEVVILTVDVEKFDRDWQRDPQSYVAPGGTSPSIKPGSYPRFGEWLKLGLPIIPPDVWIRTDPDGGHSIIFHDGRHRTAWLRDHGLTRIPVAFEAYQEKLARSLYAPDPGELAGVPPRQYFTSERIRARERGDHPEVLFHFTPRTKALKILEDGYLRGRPQLSTTENPAFGTPGPVVFVIDAECVLRKGFELWPYLWHRGAEQEAEWIVVPAGTESEHELPENVALPLECVRYVGLIGRVGAEREAIKEAAGDLGLEAGQFDWEDWWAA